MLLCYICGINELGNRNKSGICQECIEYIKYKCAATNCLNEVTGLNRKCHKCKNSGKLKGRKASEETKAKISKTRIEKGLAKGENNPMYGRKHSIESCNKISETRIERLEQGSIITWNKGLTKETDERIKKSTVSMSENHADVSGSKNPMYGKSLKDIWIEKHGLEKAEEMWIARNKNRNEKCLKYRISKPEIKIAKILDSLNIEYKSQFYLNKSYFDFYIPEYNMLIEVDGNYYHCNPRIYVNGPVNEWQKGKIDNDNRKNRIAEDNGYRLIRIWEDEIDIVWRIIC